MNRSPAMRILGIVGAAAILSFAANEGHGGEITLSPTVFNFGMVSVAGPPATGSVTITTDALVMGLNNDLPNEQDRLVNLSGTGTTPTTGVNPLAGPVGLRLLGSNPVTSATRFSYGIPERGRVKLALFDMSGRLVQSLHDAVEEAGPHEWAWSRDVSGTTPSGVYLVRLSLAGRTLGTSRVVVLKGLQ